MEYFLFKIFGFCCFKFDEWLTERKFLTSSKCVRMDRGREGGKQNADRCGLGEGGGQKVAKWCRHPLWMLPNVNTKEK